MGILVFEGVCKNSKEIRCKMGKKVEICLHCRHYQKIKKWPTKHGICTVMERFPVLGRLDTDDCPDWTAKPVKKRRKRKPKGETEWIKKICHFQYEVTDLPTDTWPPRFSRFRLPSPEKPEAHSMPFGNSVRLHENQHIRPSRPCTAKCDPESTVCVLKSRPWTSVLEDSAALFAAQTDHFDIIHLLDFLKKTFSRMEPFPTKRPREKAEPFAKGAADVGKPHAFSRYDSLHYKPVRARDASPVAYRAYYRDHSVLVCSRTLSFRPGARDLCLCVFIQSFSYLL